MALVFLLIASPRLLRTAEAPADSKALIKNTLSFFNSRLVVTQCYSVVKNHPPCGVPPGWVGHHCPKFDAKQPVFDGLLLTPNLGQPVTPVTDFHVETLVELSGIEPLTPWLQTRCSPS